MDLVVFACVHNAGRSQMAEAFFNRLADPARATAVSAGTRPAGQVHPEVVDAMAEEGLDLGTRRPRALTPDLAARAGLLVTLGCAEACPVVPGLATEDWPLDDPKGGPPERVRQIRDEVRRRVEELVVRRRWVSPSLRAARQDDLAAARALLREAALPEDGLEDAFPQGYLVAEAAGRVVGAAGVEEHGRFGLLRSVVVAPAWRGRGLGEALARDRIQWARGRGRKTMFLLTTTAADFFPRLGFAPVDRDTAPPEIRASREFAQACPASASLLRLEL